MTAAIDEVASLLANSKDLDRFLDSIVSMVAEHLCADVCSIYLYEENSRELVLRASAGLPSKAVGAARMALGEGLVGQIMRDRKSMCLAHASRNPDYKYFPMAGEDKYDAFMGVPVQRGVEKIGVMVAQRKAPNWFSEADIRKFRAEVSRLTTHLENARAMLQVSAPKPAARKSAPTVRSLEGEPVSGGCALAPALVFKRHRAEKVFKKLLASDRAGGGAKELQVAVNSTASQLEKLQETLGKRLPEAATLIFDAHLMMLKDHVFMGRMAELIDEDDGAIQAVAKTAIEYVDRFEASTHDYMKDKARDVEDLAMRILDNLGAVMDASPPASKGHLIIAREFFPSDILRVTLADARGIILVGGGATAHVSLLVRSLDIPTVISDDPGLMRVPDGTQVFVDADAGSIHISPSEDLVDSYRERQVVAEAAREKKSAMRDSTESRDGVRVTLLANINLLSELDLALDLKAEGIGLYRTEFPFLIRQSLPTEADQELVYSRLFESMDGREVTVRTLDAGGDKVLSYFDQAGEENPALGLRSTRFSLRYPQVFDQQLRAILKAAHGREQLRVMFPMIASLDEFVEARRRLLACLDEVNEGSDTESPRPMIGMMVELPAVLDLIDDFAEEADFFSIGTNDFTQYMLAVDRTNVRVAAYYCPHHPAVLRGLKRIVDAAERLGISVSVCGEMAHDPRYVPFLLGIGIRRLSLDPHFLPLVQKVISSLTMQKARTYAETLLDEPTISGVEEHLR